MGTLRSCRSSSVSVDVVLRKTARMATLEAEVVVLLIPSSFRKLGEEASPASCGANQLTDVDGRVVNYMGEIL